ncbi:DNA/RNA nuclease SfsA [Rhodosalinus sp. K401]|uniref:DNA/RNA nuclease SfsA n=1 Tax=Rhodosalinus sp. K401 TaxID=3239195 RepID=UPI003523DE96
MRFQTPLVPATLLRRYKRFLADARLACGREVTAHVSNPGSMMGLAEPGRRIWLEPVDHPRRKLSWAWRLVEDDAGALIGVDTGAGNRLARAALEAGLVPDLAGHDEIRAEVRAGRSSRIDFRLSASGGPDTYVEVKSVTLSRRAGVAEFPDSVTRRGAKHLAELSALAAAGHRAVMLYVVQRSDARRVTLAADLDPDYARAFAAARAAGVEAVALGCRLSPDGIAPAGPLPFDVPAG